MDSWFDIAVDDLKAKIIADRKHMRAVRRKIVMDDVRFSIICGLVLAILAFASWKHSDFLTAVFAFFSFGGIANIYAIFSVKKQLGWDISR